MRFLDQHGRPRPLEDVFAEHQKDVAARLRAAEALRKQRINQQLTDVVIVRGTHGGISATDAERIYRKEG